jgi:hypothetical protein
MFGLLGKGARAQRRLGVLEFHSPLIDRLFDRLPNRPSAMTLGHVILGRNAELLDRSREHERVHVRQYERWGPAMVPAYLLCALWLWLVGSDPYWDNPFERQAFRDSR